RRQSPRIAIRWPAWRFPCALGSWFSPSPVCRVATTRATALAACAATANTDSYTVFCFDAKGTFDGNPFELECPPDFMITSRVDAGGTSVVAASCAEAGGGAFRVIGVAPNPQVDDFTECSYHTAVIDVGRIVDGSKAYYDCTDGGVNDFEMSI